MNSKLITNKKIKVLVVFGTRPEAIKLAPVINELKKNSKYFELKICVSGQHRQMLDQVLNFFKIIPDYDLNIMKKKQDLFQITSSLLSSIKSVIKDFSPDLIVIHGDTTTTLTTALAAYYSKIKIAHVEAGLRTGDIYSPWPEEGNRRLISSLADINLCPTKLNYTNLINEGVKKSSIYVTGNTVVDSIKLILRKIKESNSLRARIENNILESGFKFISKKFILVTIHRRENFDEGILEICNAIKKIADQYEDIYILWPVHFNPKITAPVTKMLANVKNIILTKPLDYGEFVHLMNRSYLIISDSGGIQEESQTIGKPVLITRNKTERPEGLKSGNLKLVGANEKILIKEIKKLLDNKKAYTKMSKKSDIFGDGTSSKKIINILKLIK